MEREKTVERYDVFELRYTGIGGKASKGLNPFTDCRIRGLFTSKNEQVETEGFYNGNGEYVIRFMPSFTGAYRYQISENSGWTDEGEFQVTEACGINHGPVRVADQYHFAYADGTPYYPVGTTCYAWMHQEEAMQEKTIASLKKGPFNKIRFCIFPKHYDYNLYEPVTYPYEGTPCSIEGLHKENFLEYLPSNPENRWDFTRFHPAHFEIIDRRVRELLSMGIEADIILFHPYDRWGFSEMK